MTANKPESVGKQPVISSGLPAERAWELWLKLTDMTDFLWESYQEEFLSFCIEDIHKRSTLEKLPFE